ncbi:SGNH/GDSL hydrolase family protein [Pseudomonas tolaasii]
MWRIVFISVLLFSGSVFSATQCSLQIGRQPKSLYVFGSVKIAEISDTYIWFDPEVGNIVPDDPQEISSTSFNYNTLYRITDQSGAQWYFRHSGEWFDSAKTKRTAFYSVQWAGGKWPALPGRYIIESVQAPRPQYGKYRFSTIGDSMTWFSDAQAVRCNLASYLPSYSFVGSRTDSFGYGHDGHGGDNSAQVIARIPIIPVSDVYLLLIGSNDGGYTPIQTAQNIASIVSGLISKSPASKIYVSTLPPRSDEYASLTKQRNSAIRNWYTGCGCGNNVMLVDTDRAMRSIPNAASRFISEDKIHPNSEGYDFISKLVSAAVRTQTSVSSPQ